MQLAHALEELAKMSGKSAVSKADSLLKEISVSFKLMEFAKSIKEGQNGEDEPSCDCVIVPVEAPDQRFNTHKVSQLLLVISV